MTPPDRDDPDDEDTGPRRPVGPTAAQLRRHVRTVPSGIPILESASELVPDPDFEWPVTPDRRDAEVLRRAARDPTEPAMPAEISAIVHKLAAKLREEFSALIPIDGQIGKRVAVLERDFDPHRRFGKWVAGVAATALVATCVFLYHRGADEQHVNDELTRLAKLVDKLEAKLESQQGPRP